MCVCVYACTWVYIHRHKHMYAYCRQLMGKATSFCGFIFVFVILPTVVVMVLKGNCCWFSASASRVPGITGLYYYSWPFTRKCIRKIGQFKGSSWLCTVAVLKHFFFSDFCEKNSLGLPQYWRLIWSLKTSNKHNLHMIICFRNWRT